jgi:hypothetical protein
MTINTKEIIERGFIKENEVEKVIKEDRLIKINLQDIDGDIESIWTALLKKTDNEAHVVLANHAVAMMPAHSWGLVVKAKTDSNDRLTAIMKEQEDSISKCYPNYVEHWKHMFKGKNDE